MSTTGFCKKYNGIFRGNTILWDNKAVFRKSSATSLMNVRQFRPDFRIDTIGQYRVLKYSFVSITTTARTFSLYNFGPETRKEQRMNSLGMACNTINRDYKLLRPFSPVLFSRRLATRTVKGMAPAVSGDGNSFNDLNNGTRNLQQSVTGPTFHVAKISYHDGSIEYLRNIALSELLKQCPSVYPRDVLTLNITSRQERSIEHAKLRSSSAARRMVGATDAAIRRSVPVFVTRNRQAIVISIGITRAVATVNDVFLFDAHNPAVKELAVDIAKTFKKNYQASQGLEQNGVAYPRAIRNEPNELIFLEAVLRDAAASYNRRIRLYEPICDSILENVTHQQTGYQPSQGNNFSHQQQGWFHNARDNIRSALSSSYDISVVQHLVPLKDSLQSFEIQVKQTIDCLNEVLENDDAMLSLLLTEQDVALKEGTTIDRIRHEHVELLIGVYARQISHISMEISYLLNRIQSKQELVALTLSSYRNRMVQLNLHLNIAALAIGFSTVIAGFFGMNVIPCHRIWFYYGRNNYVRSMFTIS
jgi:hypothetical protein